MDSIILLILTFILLFFSYASEGNSPPCDLKPMVVNAKSCMIKELSKKPISNEKKIAALESASFSMKLERSKVVSEVVDEKGRPIQIKLEYIIPKYISTVGFRSEYLRSEIDRKISVKMSELNTGCSDNYLGKYYSVSVKPSSIGAEDGELITRITGEMAAGVCVFSLKCELRTKKVLGVNVTYPHCYESPAKTHVATGDYYYQATQGITPAVENDSECTNATDRVKVGMPPDLVGQLNLAQGCSYSTKKSRVDLSELSRFFADLFNGILVLPSLLFENNLMERSLRDHLVRDLKSDGVSVKRSSIGEDDIDRVNEAVEGVSDGDNQGLLKELLNLTWDNSFIDNNLICRKKPNGQNLACNWDQYYSLEGGVVTQKLSRSPKIEELIKNSPEKAGLFIETPVACATYKEIMNAMSEYYQEGCSYKEEIAIVMKGDTLESIAKHYYKNTAYYIPLASYNGIANWDRIQPGQKIIIPTLNLLMDNHTFVKKGQMVWDFIPKNKRRGSAYLSELDRLSSLNPHIKNLSNIYPFQIIRLN